MQWLKVRVIFYSMLIFIIANRYGNIWFLFLLRLEAPTVFMETMATTTAAPASTAKIMIKNYRIMMLSMSLIKALFFSIVVELGQH